MRVTRYVLWLSIALPVAPIGCSGAHAKPARAPNKAALAEPISNAQVMREEADHDGVPDEEDRAPVPQERGLVAAPAPPTTDTKKVEGRPAQPQQDPGRDGAFLIYTAHLTMAVYQVEGSLAAVEQIGRDVGGYLASRQDREITIRVPRARFDEALTKIAATGDVVHRDIQAQDVTDEFHDTEVRLKNARAMRDRLEQLLQKAPVKEAIEIEKELGRVTEEIERMEGQLKLLKDKIAFSTITVAFDARSASLQTMPIRLPFAWLGTLGLPTLLRLNESK